MIPLRSTVQVVTETCERSPQPQYVMHGLRLCSRIPSVRQLGRLLIVIFNKLAQVSFKQHKSPGFGTSAPRLFWKEAPSTGCSGCTRRPKAVCVTAYGGPSLLVPEVTDLLLFLLQTQIASELLRLRALVPLQPAWLRTATFPRRARNRSFTNSAQSFTHTHGQVPKYTAT